MAKKGFENFKTLIDISGFWLSVVQLSGRILGYVVQFEQPYTRPYTRPSHASHKPDYIEQSTLQACKSI